jgi:hypothetical protein
MFNDLRERNKDLEATILGKYGDLILLRHPSLHCLPEKYRLRYQNVFLNAFGGLLGVLFFLVCLDALADAKANETIQDGALIFAFAGSVVISFCLPKMVSFISELRWRSTLRMLEPARKEEIARDLLVISQHFRELYCEVQRAEKELKERQDYDSLWEFLHVKLPQCLKDSRTHARNILFPHQGEMKDALEYLLTGDSTGFIGQLKTLERVVNSFVTEAEKREDFRQEEEKAAERFKELEEQLEAERKEAPAATT